MMMGQTKKKIILTAVVAFLIPVVIGSILFLDYNKKMNEEIERLEAETATEKRYVFARNMIAGDIIDSGDVKVVDVKSESVPKDAFLGDTGNSVTHLKEIVGKKILINAEANTMVAKSMFMQEDDKLELDERYQEFNMITLPSDLKVGDFIDIRITMVEGEDYLVISGKEVKKIGDRPESNTMFLQLNEEEILRMTAAIIESYMNDGYKIYANKYVEPSNQLYTYERVDFIEKVTEATKEKLAELTLLAQTDPITYLKTYESEIFEQTSGDIITSGDTYIYSGDTNVTVAETIVVTEDKITNLEVAEMVGLSEKEVEDIRVAIAGGNQSVIELYNDKLVSTRRDMKNTYPVKENIANLIKSDPNILETVKEKYNVEELLTQRATLLEFPLFTINDYGVMEMSESLTNIQQNLNKEIEEQRLERKEYLQALILAENGNGNSNN